MMKSGLFLAILGLLPSLSWSPARAAVIDPAVVPLLKRSFFHGREYFVLRSGRAKLIAQADRANLAPAFLYLLFDAQDNRQSARKERAFNFGDGQGLANSALEVVLGGFAFTALGHQTQTRWVRAIRFPAYAADVPLKTERANLLEPDATMALPIAFGLVNPRRDTARNTLDELEKLWNARWFGGGYERYHSSGQCDQPGPWTFASCFILRAQHEAGMFERSRRTLEWLNTVQGGRTGAWFEEIPLVRSQAPTAGIIPWSSGEISLFCVRHWLGVRFEGDGLVIRPAPYPGSPPVSADPRYRQGRLRLELNGSGPIREARVNGTKLKPDATGSLRLPADFVGGTVVIRTRRN